MKTPLRAFCCYARKDQPLLLKLIETYLKPLQRDGLIKIWADVHINAGLEWEQEIEKHLNAANIVLLLVSPDFMASDYAYSKEMMQAMKRHEAGETRVIPIILRSTYWRNTPFAKLQVLPTNAEPVTNSSWYNLDEAFSNVMIGIQRVVEELSGSDDTITKLLQPLIVDPQCVWVSKWDRSEEVSNIILTYDNTRDYESTMPDDIRRTLDKWCRENQPRCSGLKGEPAGVQVRLEEVKYVHEAGKHYYSVLLSPTKYLDYIAVHPHLGKVQLKSLRKKHFANALNALKGHRGLELPSNFALHMAVVSQDGYLLLRRRADLTITELFPSAWEAGIGEFMHGPAYMPDPEFSGGPSKAQFPNFNEDGNPDLFLFLKNAVAEELGYFGAQEKDFRLYGFAAEYQTLASKLLVVYNSDLFIDDLLKKAKKASDPARTNKVKLTPHAIAEAFSNPVYNTKWGWGPTSKLVILLALKQDLEEKGEGDHSSEIDEIENLIEEFRPDDKPVDPWKYPE